MYEILSWGPPVGVRKSYAFPSGNIQLAAAPPSRAAEPPILLTTCGKAELFLTLTGEPKKLNLLPQKLSSARFDAAEAMALQAGTLRSSCIRRLPSITHR